MTAPLVLPAPAATPVRWPRIVALHLAPAVPLTLFTVATAPLLDRWHLPVVWGLLIGVLGIQVPLLEVLGRHVGRPTRPSPPSRRPVMVTVSVAVICLLLPGLVTWVEPVLRTTLFAAVPAWWSLSPLSDSPTTTAVTAVLWVAAAVVAGPIAEERYFRGVLLARIPAAPVAAAVVGAALFAGYHLWQPWAVVTVFAATLPIAVARARFGLGLVGCCVAHCGVNAVLFAALMLGAAGR